MNDEAYKEKRRQAMLSALVGAPHTCGSVTFWKYLRKRTGDYAWHCYRCYPPNRSQEVLAVVSDGEFLGMEAAASTPIKRLYYFPQWTSAFATTTRSV
jgi:hypothetical protein